MFNSLSKLSASVMAGMAVVFIVFQSCKKAEPLKDSDRSEWYSGGKQTAFVSGSSAFGQMFVELSKQQEDLHSFGDRIFNASFNSDPTQLYHGLGPIFNNVSCGSCHIADGRGKAPNAGESLNSLLLRLSIPGVNATGGPLGAPNFGGQLQQRAIQGEQAEANVNVSYVETTDHFADGETYTLRKPFYTIAAPYLPLPGGVMFSPRMATPVCGLGLLEAISEADILAKVDEGDANKDGISGRANYGWDVSSNSMKLGRFGWKAAQPSIIQQSAGAFVEDMGVTNMIFPVESSSGQLQGKSLKQQKDISDSTLFAVAFYIKTLAVPGRRNVTNPSVIQGKQLFTAIGCAGCHTPKQTTQADMTFPSLSNQTIFPYTDLLLHDMGSDLSDNRPDYSAMGYEWRTSPLWGIGLTNTVNGHNNFLHDGRARNLTEAIMWHGGEAEHTRNAFKALSKSDRDALLAFLNSL